MTFKKILFIAYLLSITSLVAQSDLGFDVDYAKFNYDENSQLIELYYSFNQKTFATETNDQGEFISADLHVEIGSGENKVIDESYHLNIQVDTNTFQYKNEDLVGILAFNIPNGTYQLKVTADDRLSRNSKTYTKEIDFISLDSNAINLSDIELSSQIIQDGADTSSIYYKNNLEIIPNPKALFGMNFPVLFYYVELYNSSDLKTDGYILERIISNNKKSLEVNEEELSLSNAAVVKAGFVNMAKYSSGKYSLNINVKDSLDNIVASKLKNFYVYNPHKKADLVENRKLSYITSEFGILSEEECDHYFEAAQYISAQSEIDLYETLVGEDSKRKFLFEFWRKRDIIPETEINEYKEEYMARLDYVNSNYGHRHKKGYKTDRGRVALVYGIPDRVESRNNENEYKPYEIWYYDRIEGGVLFIFGDTMGISELELLHSNKRGEYYNEDWQSRLTIKGGF